MTEIKGAFSSAKVFTDNIEETAVNQIQLLCNQPFAKSSKIRIMPDVHTGVGCVIGFTANLGEMVIPNIVGVDIGCGMLTVELGKVDIDFEKLDNTIIEYVPSGKNTHLGRLVKFSQLQQLNCYRSLKDTRRIERSIGTLGGGNHFIEIDVDEDCNKYLVIHTGSRNLGKQVAEIYQNMAYDILCGKDKLFEAQNKLIEDYKAQGRRKEIQSAIKKLKKQFISKITDVPKELCYLTGNYRQMYLEDMGICQQFAIINREKIADIILQKMFSKSLSDYSYFQTIHNYIDLESNIVRKGAVSAKSGEKLLIPINMRDGSLICIGKGNEDWNCSAPHGAGRLMSRKTASTELSLDEFKLQMQGIYSTSVTQKTLDESPMAYKNKDEIVKNIAPTADIIKQIKPLYNFKAGE
ncbi:MAG: RtcB family protein [Ruminococcus sp.]|nr:RtcB family protein [Ruminococcus sp.]